MFVCHSLARNAYSAVQAEVGYAGYILDRALAMAEAVRESQVGLCSAL